MKKHFLQLVLAGLFALSAGTIGTVFAVVALAPPAFGAVCPGCDANNGCIGSTCTCLFEGDHTFVCSLPGPIEP
jgi:hypothetical protein